MDSNYRFTAAEDHLLLALRDQGHYTGDFIAQILDRSEWALKHRYHMLHNGLKSMNPRGKGKMEIRSFQKLHKSKSKPGWTPKRDYDLMASYRKGDDWLEISHKLTPFNAPECLARWVSFNPQARYPFKTEMDFRWTIEDINTLLSMKREGRTWVEIAQALPWDVMQCRKHWFTNHWFAFIFWFPDGRNFQDQPQFWQQKIGVHPHQYAPQWYNINTTADPRSLKRIRGWDRDPREDEDVLEISEERYLKESFKNTERPSKPKKPSDKTAPKKPSDNTAPKKPKHNKRDALGFGHTTTKWPGDVGQAGYMLEQAEIERYMIINPRHAAERQNYGYR